MPTPTLTTSASHNSIGTFSKELSLNRQVIRLLIAGFLLIIALLTMDGIFGFRSIIATRRNVSSLMESQFRNVVLIDEVQRTQSTLGLVLNRLSANEYIRDRAQLEVGVNNIEQSLRALFSGVSSNDPDIRIWREVEEASRSVTAEADRILALPANTKPDLTKLLNSRERLVSATTRLMHANHERAGNTQQQIDKVTSHQLLQDGILLGGCLIISCLCALLVLRTATRLHYQMAEQAEELGRVSWQLLEKHEHLARRISHELHDELGQALTALKTNFSRHSSSKCVDPAWMADCSELLRESIRSTHEISQLLRPTILDDFGLDSALSWLCERVEERNRITVEYNSSFDGRLDVQAETHLFRIAQEALTNVARHANASKVIVTLTRDEQTGRLKIADNGVGLSEHLDRSRIHFGLTGMKARARSLHGNMTITSNPQKGTEIEISFPWREGIHEDANPHFTGR